MTSRADASSTPPNPWLERRVLSYAHQGGAWEAPSSTLFAVRHALALGVTGIELDVHATADRHLVVCHDGTVDRTTQGHGPVRSHTLAELRELDNAYWFVLGGEERQGLPEDAYVYRGRAPADTEFAIATLDEVLEVMDEHPEVALNLDIKATAPFVEPYEDLLAGALRDHGNTDRVIVASFEDTATEAFATLAPEIATSAGTVTVASFWRAIHRGDEPPRTRHVAFQVPARRGDQVVVDEQFVEAAHALGVAVHVWTVNDEKEVMRLCDLSVDGIISDLPTMLIGRLAERGLTYHP